MAEIVPLQSFEPQGVETNLELWRTTALSLTQHPVAVYLAHLSVGSRRTMRQSLDEIARLLTQNQCDALTIDWAALFMIDVPLSPPELVATTIACSGCG